MKTLNELAAQTGVELDEHLVRDLEIPVLSGVQCQGDLIVLPASAAGRIYPAAVQPVPAQGVELLRGQHPHVLVADPGTCRVLRLDGQDLAVVDADAAVHLLHPEHGGMGLAPGRYVVRRQREQAEQQRLVAD